VETAFHAALKGDTRAARAAAAEPGAWSLALRAALAVIDGTPAPPSAEVLSQHDLAARPTQHALEHAETHAFVSFDLPALAALLELRRRVSPEGTPERERAELMLALLEGRPPPPRTAGEATPELELELSALRALAAPAAGLAEGVELARRAARSARVSERRAGRYLASLSLARLRRLSGRPHLSARILSTLMPYLPPPWRGWLHWELELAGEPHRAEALAPARGTAAVLELRALVRAAQQGDDAALTRAAGALRQAAAECGILKDDAEALLSLLDFRGPSDAWRAFLEGETQELPRGLSGLVGDPGSSSPAPVAYVAVLPGRRPRRVLGLCAAAMQQALGARVIDPTRLHAGRADAALATLALAGAEGLDEGALFRACYGFRYVARLHEAALGMLLHRARARLPDGVTLSRDGGRLRLDASAPVLIADPRCTEHVEGRLLRLVARDGAVTTRQAARTLGVSLRTVQAAMAQLVERGDCSLDRAGRRIAYRVDDTSQAIEA